jgi:hypothetical protein
LILNFFTYSSNFIAEFELVENQIILDKLPQEILRTLVNLQDIINASKDLLLVQKCEEILDKWIRKVTQLIIQSNEIRLESDDAGPLVELDYYRKISVKFHCVLEQLNEPENKILIQVLNSAINRKLWV